MSKKVSIWMAIAILLGGSATVWVLSKYVLDRGYAVVHTDRIIPAPLGLKVSQFALTERSERVFASAELDGQVYVASFFYSACPSVCRIQNQKIRELCREFGPRGVKFLSITCDPSTDTPAVLRSYAQTLAADRQQWLFLTGEFADIQRVAHDSFRVAIAPRTHSERLIAVDHTGSIRGSFLSSDPRQVEKLKALLSRLLVGQQAVENNGRDDQQTSAEILGRAN